jgi:hypothetical protein
MDAELIPFGGENATPAPRTGQPASRREITVDPIGAGGMGEAYMARDGRPKRHVALKILPAAMPTRIDFVPTGLNFARPDLVSRRSNSMSSRHDSMSSSPDLISCQPVSISRDRPRFVPLELDIVSARLDVVLPGPDFVPPVSNSRERTSLRAART